MMKTFRGFGRSFLAALNFIAARGSEPSTYATLTAVLAALHFAVDPGVVKIVSMYGLALCGALGVLLSEAGRASPFQVASDVADALRAGLTVASDNTQAADSVSAPARRDVLKTVGGGTVALAALSLARCSSTSLPAAIITAADDISAIGSALPTALTTTLLTSLGLSAATVQQVEGYLTTVTTDAGVVAADVQAATTPPTSTVQTIVTLAEDAVNIAAPLLAVAAPEMAVVAGVIALLPVIASAFGITAASRVQASVLAHVPQVDPATARQNLANWLATHPAA